MFRLGIMMAGILGTVLCADAYAAGTCVAGDAPAAYTGSSCNPGGSAAGDICQLLAGGVMDCGLARHGATTSADGTMVANFTTGSNKYSGWGTDATGATFCCIYSGANVTDLQMHGGSYGDLMSFTYDNGTTRWDLGPSGAMSIPSVTAEMYGEQGNDDLFGSFNSTLNYAETLDGMTGDDTIEGNDGADECRGSDGADTIYGGLGIDTILGGNGNDQIKGGGDDDDLNGNANNDVICDTNGDTINGGWGSDKLWLPTASSGTIAGGGGLGTDVCGYNGGPTITGCSFLVTTIPTACSLF